MKQLREIFQFWQARLGQPLALATLVASRGSSYRRPGARMIIDEHGESAGGVSAGCIEEEVSAAAVAVLRDGGPRSMTFDTRLRFGCHGAIEIRVECIADELMAEWHACLKQRRRCTLVTDLHGTRIGRVESTAGAFVQTIEPVLRLILIGNGTETAALHAHATFLGWDVIHLPATSASLPPLDERTAVVLATHHFGRDCAALRELLPAGLRYLGVVGSRRRREDLLFDVMQSGVRLESELFAPAGLHLGAESPEEIALSITAEIQCVFAAGNGQSLRHRQSPIHHPAPALTPCVASAA
ncbi:MAG: XdhC family protein [Prosthecobacter sp.]|jgi:xanthine dehydrogenase accessory factor|uniref:XdhC family protein n=1 Tax=Prosthecobacter sp. TaxID=1965333 RepID=UPI001A05322E|nr:XdhC family protein [Prosthecobacter sp.]MBE2285646.1 XdhC family protein [Prosthecobacter sp.]